MQLRNVSDREHPVFRISIFEFRIFGALFEMALTKEDWN